MRESPTPGTEDLFLATGVVASALMLSRAPLLSLQDVVGFDSSMQWLGIVLGICSFGALMAPITLLSVIVSYRIRDLHRRVIAMAGLAGGTSFVILGIVSMTYVGAVGLDQILAPVLFGAFFGYAIVFSGLGLLKASGFCLSSVSVRKGNQVSRLPPTEHMGSTEDAATCAQDIPVLNVDSSVSREATAAPTSERVATLGQEPSNGFGELPTSPFDFSEPNAEFLRRDRWSARTMAAGFLLVAVVANLIASNVQKKREVERERNIEFAQRLQKSGGNVTITDRYITRIKAPASFDDVQLREFSGLTELSEIDLSGTHVTDACIEQLIGYPNLISINLHATHVTDKGIEKLAAHAGYYQLLDIGSTQVTSQGLKKLESLGLDTLVVSDLDLSDQDLKAFSSLSCDFIDIRSNPIQSLALLKGSFLSGIHVGGNPFSLEELTTLSSLSRVSFTDFPITDQEFAEFVKKNPNLESIEFTATGLTDAALTSVQQLKFLNALTIGDGNFSEAGLQTAMPNVQRLRIHSKSFTGGCLSALPANLLVLDLSDSGLDDANLALLRPSASNALQAINLSRTQISKRGLSSLAALSFYELDLRETAISAQDLKESKLPAYVRVIVEYGRFTQQELRSLGGVIQIEEDGESYYDY